jgi:hypothetical protein
VLPSIARLVSLDQTSTLTYIPSGALGSACDVSRSLSASPIALEKLVLDVRGAVIQASRLTDLRAPPTVKIDTLLLSVDPRHVQVLACPSTKPRPGRLGCLLDTPADLAWSQLRSIKLVNAMTCESLALSIPCAAHRVPLVEVEYDFSVPEGHPHSVLTELDYITSDLSWVDPNRQRPALGKVQLWVQNAEEVAEAKASLADDDLDCESLEIKIKP